MLAWERNQKQRIELSGIQIFKMRTNSSYSLGLVTENQNSVQKAEALTALMVDHLPNINNFHIERYDNFPSSFRIELEGLLANPDDQIRVKINNIGSKLTEGFAGLDQTEDIIKNEFERLEGSTSNIFR